MLKNYSWTASGGAAVYARRETRVAFDYPSAIGELPNSVLDVLTAWERVKGADPVRMNSQEFDNLLSSLYPKTHYVKGLKSSSRNLGEYWCRIRKLTDDSERYTSIEQLIYPPKPQVDFGRCHVPRDTVLYASRRWGTACDELGLEPGDCFQALFFDTDMLTVWCVGELAACFQSGISAHGFVDSPQWLLENFIPKYSESELLAEVTKDDILAELFSTKSDDKRKIEYRFSGRISSNFFNCTIEPRGILFRSVRDPFGYNLAVNKAGWDFTCRPRFSNRYRITDRIRPGMYKAEILSLGTSIENGIFKFQNEIPTKQFVYSNRSGFFAQ